jgi:putative transposase
VVRLIRQRLPRLGTRKLLIKVQEYLGGVRIGRDHFFELLRQHGLLIKPSRRRGIRTTNSRHLFRKYPDLTEKLEITRPNQLWVADITYVELKPQYLFLSLITDAYSHQIMGYCLSPTLETSGPLQALRQALKRLPADRLPLIHHSDRGIQYASQAYSELLKENAIQISMTQSGDPRENAIAERLNGILKYEFDIVRGFQTHAQAVKHISQAIQLYNHERPHASCDMLTPVKAHEQLGPLKKHWSKRTVIEPVKEF